MPTVTPKQHRAMEAAAHGKSTLGIPESVGQEFVAADAGMSVKKRGNNFRHDSGQFHHDPLEKGYTKP